MEEVVVSDVVMSSSYTRYMSITSKVSAVFAHQFRTTHPPSRITYVGWVGCLPKVFISVNENFISAAIDGLLVMAGGAVSVDLELL
jgi:hypothetical protein